VGNDNDRIRREKGPPPDFGIEKPDQVHPTTNADSKLRSTGVSKEGKFLLSFLGGTTGPRVHLFEEENFTRGVFCTSAKLGCIWARAFKSGYEKIDASLSSFISLD